MDDARTSHEDVQMSTDCQTSYFVSCTHEGFEDFGGHKESMRTKESINLRAVETREN